MINVSIYRNTQGNVYGFTVKNHGSSYVCAAVSMLVINTINCIERFVNEPATVDVSEDAGYISCNYPRIKEGFYSEGAALLLNTMVFGLNGVLAEHNNDISISDKEVST